MKGKFPGFLALKIHNIPRKRKKSYWSKNLPSDTGFYTYEWLFAGEAASSPCHFGYLEDSIHIHCAPSCSSPSLPLATLWAWSHGKPVHLHKEGTRCLQSLEITSLLEETGQIPQPRFSQQNGLVPIGLLCGQVLQQYKSAICMS